jgi:hypothetical protein
MKKTGDGRIIDKRVIIDKKLFRDILYKVKIEKNWSWNEFARALEVSTHSLMSDWLQKDSTIPLRLLLKIIRLNKSISKETIMKKIKIIEPFWGQKLQHGKMKAKSIKVPDNNSEELAEFYGMMLGDGCLFSDLKGLSITADKILDYDYLTKYIDNLIYELFNLHPKYYFAKDSRAMRCVLYSKNAVGYLANLGFPIGFKKDLHIPKFISQNKACLIKCLRGLMDTDGSLSSHPHSKIMIHLSITSKTLREEVSEALSSLRINHGKFNKGIMLYSRNAKDFCELIGFSNLKNTIKYNLFLEKGIVPKSREVESFIRLKKS